MFHFTDSSAAASTYEQPLQTLGKLCIISYFSFYHTQYDFKPGCFSSKTILFNQKKFLTGINMMTLFSINFS